MPQISRRHASFLTWIIYRGTLIIAIVLVIVTLRLLGICCVSVVPSVIYIIGIAILVRRGVVRLWRIALKALLLSVTSIVTNIVIVWCPQVIAIVVT